MSVSSLISAGEDDVFDKEESRSETASTTSSKTESRDLLGYDSKDPEFRPPRKKRKYTHHLPPPTDIKTRGAKLPKYSFERKTHKKVLISDSGMKSSRGRTLHHKLSYSLSAPAKIKVEKEIKVCEIPLLN